jgi:hypothetical protein
VQQIAGFERYINRGEKTAAFLEAGMPAPVFSRVG